MKERVLVIDDDLAILDSIRLCLEREGYGVIICSSALTAIEAARREGIQLVILDVMLPFIDGLEIARRLRSTLRTSKLPILMLTAKDQLDDRVAGLEAGADDYLVKPFAIPELLARIRALLRRAARDNDESSILIRGGIVLDRQAREASRDGRSLTLAAREFDLLALLLANAGRVLSRETIMRQVWGESSEDHSRNVIDVYLYALRKKLGLPNVVHSVRGAGFIFRE